MRISIFTKNNLKYTILLTVVISEVIEKVQFLKYLFQDLIFLFPRRKSSVIKNSITCFTFSKKQIY